MENHLENHFKMNHILFEQWKEKKLPIDCILEGLNFLVTEITKQYRVDLVEYNLTPSEYMDGGIHYFIFKGYDYDNLAKAEGCEFEKLLNTTELTDFYSVIGTEPSTIANDSVLLTLIITE